MSYESLKSAVSAVITANGNNEITGAILETLINDNLIPQLGAAKFRGVAVTTTNPGTPDNEVFYIASKNGVYPNFGAVEVNNEISIFKWGGTSWEVFPLTRKNIPIFSCFEPFQDSKTIDFDRKLVSSPNGVLDLTVSDFYGGFSNLELSGFDISEPHKFWFLGRNSATQRYRFIISSYTGSAWVYRFDSGSSFEVTESTTGITQVEHTIGDKTVRFGFDYSLLPDDDFIKPNGTGDSGAVDTDNIIKRECFKIDAQSTIQSENKEPISSVAFLSYRERFKAFSEFKPTSEIGYADKIPINSTTFFDMIVRDFYGAFDFIKLYGFDILKPHKLWFVARNAGVQKYRFIIDSYNGTSWDRVFDSQPIDVVENAEGLTYVSKTIGTKKVEFAVDYTVFPENFIKPNHYRFGEGTDAGENSTEFIIRQENVFSEIGGNNNFDQSLNTSDNVNFNSVTSASGNIDELTTSILIANLPEGAGAEPAGLQTGQAWIDTSNGRVIKQKA